MKVKPKSDEPRWHDLWAASGDTSCKLIQWSRWDRN